MDIEIFFGLALIVILSVWFAGWLRRHRKVACRVCGEKRTHSLHCNCSVRLLICQNCGCVRVDWED